MPSFQKGQPLPRRKVRIFSEDQRGGASGKGVRPEVEEHLTKGACRGIIIYGNPFALGLGGGFLSGLLGLGGAIFMIPLLLYVPPILGVGHLDIKQVAAVSMVQVLAASR
jgi:hypothetical protein